MEESSYNYVFIYFVFSMITWLQIAPWNTPVSVRNKKRYRTMLAIAVLIWPLFWSYFFYHLIKRLFKKS